MYKQLSNEAKLYFRDEIRLAIAKAQKDAEGYQDILFTIEKLGMVMSGKIRDLGKYKDCLSQLVKESSPREAYVTQLHKWHLPFEELYDIVREARNDALHSGTVARHLTKNAIRIALILEEALMNDAIFIREFMVRDPTCAYFWQPVGLARQQMLANGFTNLPIFDKRNGHSEWKLLSDFQVAKYLQSRPKNKKVLLAKTIQDAFLDNELQLLSARTCSQNSKILEVITDFTYLPILVVDDYDREKLIGILTPFDLL
jgi:hypothetical protein